MTIAGPQVLVTGAAGVVGRATVAALRAAGFDAIGVARAGPGLAIDLSADSAVQHLLTSISDAPEAIVHLAAAVPHSAHYPDDDDSAALTRAIDQTIDRVQAAWGSTLVYMSSCGLYDRDDPATKLPDTPLDPVPSPYFAAKLDGERRFDGRAAIVRLAAPIGPGIPQGLVAARFVAAARAGDAIELWGSGTREQDFIDVRDVATLMLAAVVSGVHGTFNCARGVAVTMTELAQEVVSVIGRGDVRFVDRDDPADGQTARYDIGATTAAFGWTPRLSLAAMLSTL